MQMFCLPSVYTTYIKDQFNLNVLCYPHQRCEVSRCGEAWVGGVHINFGPDPVNIRLICLHDIAKMGVLILSKLARIY